MVLPRNPYRWYALCMGTICLVLALLNTAMLLRKARLAKLAHQSVPPFQKLVVCIIVSLIGQTFTFMLHAYQTWGWLGFVGYRGMIIVYDASCLYLILFLYLTLVTAYEAKGQWTVPRFIKRTLFITQGVNVVTSVTVPVLVAWTGSSWWNGFYYFFLGSIMLLLAGILDVTAYKLVKTVRQHTLTLQDTLRIEPPFNRSSRIELSARKMRSQRKPGLDKADNGSTRANVPEPIERQLSPKSNNGSLADALCLTSAGGISRTATPSSATNAACAILGNNSRGPTPRHSVTDMFALKLRADREQEQQARQERLKKAKRDEASVELPVAISDHPVEHAHETRTSARSAANSCAEQVDGPFPTIETGSEKPPIAADGIVGNATPSSKCNTETTGNAGNPWSRKSASHARRQRATKGEHAVSLLHLKWLVLSNSILLFIGAILLCAVGMYFFRQPSSVPEPSSLAHHQRIHGYRVLADMSFMLFHLVSSFNTWIDRTCKPAIGVDNERQLKRHPCKTSRQFLKVPWGSSATPTPRASAHMSGHIEPDRISAYSSLHLHTGGHLTSKPNSARPSFRASLNRVVFSRAPSDPTQPGDDTDDTDSGEASLNPAVFSRAPSDPTQASDDGVARTE